MEAWEKRWKHNCDVYDIHCETNGFPVQKHEKGVLKREHSFTVGKFNGPLFYKRLAELGHTHASEDMCKCCRK